MREKAKLDKLKAAPLPEIKTQPIIGQPQTEKSVPMTTIVADDIPKKEPPPQSPQVQPIDIIKPVEPAAARPLFTVEPIDTKTS